MTLDEVLQQHVIPVIYKSKVALACRMPFREDNRAWLKNGRLRHPEYNKDRKFWRIPKAWFNDTIRRFVRRFKSVYVIQPLNILEVCAPACMNATGFECTCSCLGVNHGIDRMSEEHGWVVISEVCAIRVSDVHYSIKLLRCAS